MPNQNSGYRDRRTYIDYSLEGRRTHRHYWIQGQVYLKRLLDTGTGVLKETPGYTDRPTYRACWLQGHAYLNRILATGTGVLIEITGYRDRRT